MKLIVFKYEINKNIFYNYDYVVVIICLRVALAETLLGEPTAQNDD